MNRRRIVVVGNGGMDHKRKTCFLKTNFSDVVDSADEVVRFQACANYHTGLVGTKATSLVMRDVFDPHTSRIISKQAHLTIPEEVLGQITEWYMVVSGAAIYEVPPAYQKKYYQHEDRHPYYRPWLYDEKEYYAVIADTTPYYDRYPQLRDKPVTRIHQHDTTQYYRKYIQEHRPSAGFVFLYYLMYYTSLPIEHDVELVGFTWTDAGHVYNIEKEFVENMQAIGLIKRIHSE